MKLPFLVASLAFALSVAAGFGHAADTSQAPASGGDGAARPVVLELFTSQGCSSCPPADRLAGILARDPSLLVITRPVTYWDRLGWKDTLARAENTDLQRAYSRRISTGQGVYTPQIVVNEGSSFRGTLAARLQARTFEFVRLAITEADGCPGLPSRPPGPNPEIRKGEGRC